MLCKIVQLMSTIFVDVTTQFPIRKIANFEDMMVLMGLET